MRPRLLTAGLLIAVLTTSVQAQAGALTKGLREALEYVGKKFGREVAEGFVGQEVGDAESRCRFLDGIGACAFTSPPGEWRGALRC